MTTKHAPSLRERQHRQTEDELMSQFLRLALEKGLEGFTLQDVADRAGVSIRTLYRYYPGRDALLDDAASRSEALDERLAEARGPVTDWLHNPDFTARTFQAFEAASDLVRVGRLLRTSGVDGRAALQRSELLRGGVREEGIPAAALDQLTGLLRLLGGSDAWMRLTEPDIGLDAAEAGHAAQWAIEVLIEAARQADGPLRATGKETP